MAQYLYHPWKPLVSTHWILSFVYVYVCVHAHMFVWVGIHAGTCGHVRVVRRQPQGIFLRKIIRLFFESVSLAWSSSVRLEWLASEPQRPSSSLHLPSPGMTSTCHHACIFIICILRIERRSPDVPFLNPVVTFMIRRSVTTLQLYFQWQIRWHDILIWK